MQKEEIWCYQYTWSTKPTESLEVEFAYFATVFWEKSEFCSDKDSLELWFC